MKQPAIRYRHFVKTNRRQDCQPWLKSNARGEYVFDSGVWRDRATLQEQGVEFELEHDAHAFILKFGGSYSERTMTKHS